MNIAELIEAARAAGTFLRASNARGVDFDFAKFLRKKKSGSTSCLCLFLSVVRYAPRGSQRRWRR